VDNFAQPSDLGQFVPVGGINLTKISWDGLRAVAVSACVRVGLVDLGQFVPVGGINLTKISWDGLR
jgi:hypothetical protein